MDRAVVRLAALIVLAGLACMRSSSKDEHAAPAGASRGEAHSTEAQSAEAHATAASPSSASPPPAIAPAAKPSTAIRIESVADARAAIGKRVRLEGTGDNAKLGAVVVKGDLVVYCTDRKDGWDTRNVPVIVEGVLDYTSHARAQVGSNGSISAGTGEPIFQMSCDLVR
jgi:hypothetical protein